MEEMDHICRIRIFIILFFEFNSSGYDSDVNYLKVGEIWDGMESVVVV